MISPSSSSSSGGKDLDTSKHNSSDVTTLDDGSPSPDHHVTSQDVDDNRCVACMKVFRTLDELCTHQTELGHLELKQTPSGPGYLCWKKGCNQYFPSANSLQMHFREIHARSGGVTQQQTSIAAVSEKHVYKYRCNQCSLAFKTMEKLQLHSQYHLIRDATKCVLCGRSFRSVLALHKHVETSHSELADDELAAYKQSLMNNPLLLAGLSGQVLDPSTNDLLKKESLKLDSEDGMDIDDCSSKDQNQDDSIGGNGQSGDGENSDDSVIYKEQQFLEDYLNSQAIAEDSYNDPNRKYKCHRCKVAFTRQSYLTSHNKTLLHRKGEKLSYPMEKYLDPNRPYKCDVCKESFTQKNILLVHYNSVSHLHKLKRAMQEQQQQNNNNTSPHAAAAALAASLGVTPPPTPKANTCSDDDDKKPYKCNICKVAYSQGSTLDIHMRSVLHQTRASKLQDLAMTGQIDLSKPLIEQPEPQKAQDQHKKLLQEMLGNTTPKHLQMASPPASQGPSPTITNTPTCAVSTVTTPIMSSVPTSLSGSSAQQTVSNSPSPQQHQQQHGMLSCQRCNALFVNQEQLTTHQQLYCIFGSPMSLFSPLGVAGGQNSASGQMSHSSPQANKTPPPNGLQTSDEHLSRLTIGNRKSNQVYKHLLESFGFDLVMQFNENHQRRQQRKEEESLLMSIDQPEPEACEQTDKMEEDHTEQDLPELAKSVCQHCKKEFSSVWVLKAHCEEVHRDLVPLAFLEKYAQRIKSEYEKKSVVTSSAGPDGVTVVDKEVISDDHKDSAGGGGTVGKAQQCTPPSDSLQPTTAPSTPTASSTPASSTDSIPATMSMSSQQSQQQNLSLSLAQQMNEMLSVMAVQQQLQQTFSPVVMGMAAMGLGPLGLNMGALAAMNLQPPLVPMMMPPPHFDPLGQLFGPGAAPEHLLAKQQQHLMQQQQAVSYISLLCAIE